MPASKDPVFVTGGTGFIGVELIKHLRRSDRVVHALVRSTDKARSLIKDEGVRLFEGDLEAIDVMRRAMTGCTEVYHLAGYAKLWHRDMSMFYKVNVKGLQNVLAVAMECAVRRVVFTSTAGAIGPSGSYKVTENSPRTAPPTTEYERSKIAAEQLIPGYLDKGIEVVTVNPTRVFGPGQLNQSNSVTLLIRDYVGGRWKFIPGDGKRIGNYVFVEDVVRGHMLAMRHGQTGARYILGGANLSYNELFAILQDVSGVKHQLYKVPIPIMMGLARIQQLKADVFKSEPLITPGFVKKYTFDWETDHSKATREIQYEVTEFELALSKTLKWLDFAKTVG